ncbi:MAG: type IA DNA topoisomerase [Lachnospiraceae bacterium]|nr:type IA DNA topoisomerase [Lachnospiraceae bacterium]
MAKALYIAEKPSVAQEFANVLGVSGRKQNGYIESQDAVVTWCVGHLVTMSYPEKYDGKYRRWSLDTLPFLPKKFRYEVIDSVAKQFETVKSLLNRPDVDTIYICTDSGREGEYIYRLVDQMAGVRGKARKRVWIDSQTHDEIRRGIREAKDWADYDNLAASAYLRAKEDYLMGINFSRLLTLKYGQAISAFLRRDRTVLSVGRVMTCVLGMVVRREREVREFVKTPFYRVLGEFGVGGPPAHADKCRPGQISHDGMAGPGRANASNAMGGDRVSGDADTKTNDDVGAKVSPDADTKASPDVGADGEGNALTAEWRVQGASMFAGSPHLYRDNGFKDRESAQALIGAMGGLRMGDGMDVLRMGDRSDLSDKPGRAGTGASGGVHGLQAMGTVSHIEKKKETKNAPLLYNLAELQNDCSRLFKISPDETLKVVQELYEKKLVTYPRTDARVLSTAVSKEIRKNLEGLTHLDGLGRFAAKVLAGDTYKKIGKSRYCNDAQITDHYAIIPTGQGLGAGRGFGGGPGADDSRVSGPGPGSYDERGGVDVQGHGAYRGLGPLHKKVYELVARRFLAIFYPPAVYQKYTVELTVASRGVDPGGFAENRGATIGPKTAQDQAAPTSAPVQVQAKAANAPGPEDTVGWHQELFAATFRSLQSEGYLAVAQVKGGKAPEKDSQDETAAPGGPDANVAQTLGKLKKGMVLPVNSFSIKEGETTPPKRYNSGSLILAMENAGQLIEDEELRAQIKGAGIGTSATRAEILKKLVTIQYLALSKKTQLITPTLLGEAVFDVVASSIHHLLNPDLTASWEKGLAMVSQGSITDAEYMEKLEAFIVNRTNGVLRQDNRAQLQERFRAAAKYY